jgi:hypothetical protein
LSHANEYERWQTWKVITKPTTLILGAGASQPFGFPTGYELLLRALDCVRGGNRAIFQWLNIPALMLEAFAVALRESGKKSVDSFLEHRPDFQRLGKAVIAHSLIACERRHELFKRDGNNWYEYLFNELNTQFSDFDQNQLSILTFNYDRSLEYFLLTSLHHSYGKPLSECAEKLKCIPIIHLHGDLGELPDLGSGDSVRPYEEKLSQHSLQIATNRIKIIHEGIDNDPQFSLAHKILSKSEYIYFLGFGYNPLNIKRLGFKDAHSYSPAFISGSTLGFTSAEIAHLNSIFFGRLTLTNKNALNCDVLKYLHESNILQTSSY